MIHSEVESDEAQKIEDIGIRMQRGDPVSFQDQLRFFRYRESVLSVDLACGDPEIYHVLEHIREQIDAINEQIMNSGPSGGGTTGESSRSDAHNTPH